jgi:hypothetical protein
MIGGTQKSRPAEAGRWPLVAALFVFAIDVDLWLTGIGSIVLAYHPGWDFTEHRDAAARWLAGGSFYWPWELAGPFQVWGTAHEPILYPPTILPLLVPFTVLPSWLWWAIPIAITGLVVWRHRTPARLALVLALCCCPLTMTVVWYGNPGMWITAVLALALEWPGFAPWVLLKPSLFPFALYRIHHRAWWVGLAAFALVSLPFAGLWLDWLRAVLNSRQDAGLLYSLWSIPPLLIPLAVAGPRWTEKWRRRLQRRQITMRITGRPALRDGSRTFPEPQPRR